MDMDQSQHGLQTNGYQRGKQALTLLLLGTRKIKVISARSPIGKAVLFRALKNQVSFSKNKWKMRGRKR